MFVLKIIGFTIAGAVGLALFLLLIVLFVPIRYKGKCIVGEKKTDIALNFSFLLRFISFSLAYDGKKTFTNFRIGPFGVRGGKKQKAAKTDRTECKNDPGEEKDEKEKKDGISFGKRIKNVFRNRSYITALWEKERSLLIESLKKVKKEIVRILPRRVSGHVEFGFDDPCTTGEILGLISVLYAVGLPEITVCPDFTKKMLEADAVLSGRIRIFNVALTAFLLYSNREIRKTLHKFRRYSEITPEERKNG